MNGVTTLTPDSAYIREQVLAILQAHPTEAFTAPDLHKLVRRLDGAKLCSNNEGHSADLGYALQSLYHHPLVQYTHKPKAWGLFQWKTS